MEDPSKRQRTSRTHWRRKRASDQPREEHADEVLAAEPSPSSSPAHIMELRDPLHSREKGSVQVVEEKRRRIRRRRQVAIIEEMTVIVSVKVDQNGVTLAVHTLPPVPAVPTVPSVPPFPSNLLPPSVPPFPSLKIPAVPSYPFGPTSTAAVAFIPNPAVSLPTPTPSPASLAGVLTPGNTTTTPSAPSAAAAGNDTVSVANFQNSSLASSLSSLSSLSSSSNGTLTLSNTLSSLRSSDTSTTSEPAPYTTIDVTLPGGNPEYHGTPGGSPSQTGTAAAASNSAAQSKKTAAVVGGVFGGLAGVALVLVLVLVLLRWYRRHRQSAMQRLDDDDALERPADRSIEPPMTEQRRSFIPGAAAGFFNRFSTGSKETDPGSPTQERGFQKISGRKLPSAFSEGITEADIQGRHSKLSETSIYRDSQGFFVAPSMERSGASTSHFEKETMMPSPARTPVIHNPFAFNSPPRTPTQSSVNVPGSLGRSHPSQDGSRGSKFTENV